MNACSKALGYSTPTSCISNHQQYRLRAEAILAEVASPFCKLIYCVMLPWELTVSKGVEYNFNQDAQHQSFITVFIYPMDLVMSPELPIPDSKNYRRTWHAVWTILYQIRSLAHLIQISPMPCPLFHQWHLLYCLSAMFPHPITAEQGCTRHCLDILLHSLLGHWWMDTTTKIALVQQWNRKRCRNAAECYVLVRTGRVFPRHSGL